MNDSLRHLEDHGYLTRAPSPEDGRARLIRLTARGEALQEVIRAAGRRVGQEWKEEVGETDWGTVTRMLDRLVGVAPDAGEQR